MTGANGAPTAREAENLRPYPVAHAVKHFALESRRRGVQGSPLRSGAMLAKHIAGPMNARNGKVRPLLKIRSDKHGDDNGTNGSET
ncbi:hypothetical protein GCM10027161_04090 [Microbispora hainanensis]